MRIRNCKFQWNRYVSTQTWASPVNVTVSSLNSSTAKNGIHLHSKMERFEKKKKKEVSLRVFRQNQPTLGFLISTFRRVTFPSSSLEFSRFRLFSYIPPESYCPRSFLKAKVSLHSGRVIAGNGNQISEFH